MKQKRNSCSATFLIKMMHRSQFFKRVFFFIFFFTVCRNKPAKTNFPTLSCDSLNRSARAASQSWHGTPRPLQHNSGTTASVPPLHFGGKNNSSRRNPSLVLGLGAVLVTLLKADETRSDPSVWWRVPSDTDRSEVSSRPQWDWLLWVSTDRSPATLWIFQPSFWPFLCVLYSNVFCFACSLQLLGGGLKTVLLRHGSGRLPERSHGDVLMSFHLYTSRSNSRKHIQDTSTSTCY